MTVAGEIEDYIGLTRLQSAYADCVTRRSWDELDQLFRPDATLLVSDGHRQITIQGPTAIGALIDRAVASLDLIFFVNLNTRIEMYPEGEGTARARTYIRELHFANPLLVAKEIYGVYLDRYVRSEDRWWFASREWHALARTAPELEAYAGPHQLDGWLAVDDDPPPRRRDPR
jgi:SnoaL-like domain